MDGTIKWLEGWILWFEKSRLAGVIYGTGLEEKGAVQGKPVLAEAYNMGKDIK